MRPMIVAFGIAAATACGGTSDRPRPDGESSSTAPSPGIPSAERLPELLDTASKLGEQTWPGARIGGIRIGDEVPRGARANVYSLRVSFEFERDPSDPSAKSGAVLCSPACTVLRAKIRRAAAPPFPCSLTDALAAARTAGLSTERPLIGYGYWNLDGRSGWTFRARPDGPVIEVGEDCVATQSP